MRVLSIVKWKLVTNWLTNSSNLCYYPGMHITYRNPSDFNPLGLTRKQIARRAGLSWPAVDLLLNPERRMGNRVALSTYLSVIIALRPADWQRLTLGELFEVTDD